MMNQGLLFIIEGLDGAGKTTQTQKLITWLQQEQSKKVVMFDFPAYDKTPFGKIIGHYLKGEYCDPVMHDPFESTLLYAGDRMHLKKELISALDSGACVIINRYVPSNIAYSCAKLQIQGRSNEIQSFIKFNEELEYELLGMPRPDCIIFLDIEPNQANELIKTRSGTVREYLAGEERDKYESNRNLQSYVRDSYQLVANSGVWHIVKTNDVGTTLRSVDEIQEDVRKIVRSRLNK